MTFKKVTFKSGTKSLVFEIGKLGICIGNNGFAIDYVGGFHYEFWMVTK